MIDQWQDPKTPEWLDRESFPFRSRYLATSFGRLHYVDEGPPESEEVVLLVHGTPSWSFEYRRLIPVLAASRRVIAIDHLGFGLSERPRDFPYTPEAHTEVLRAAISALGLSSFSLVVHDYGGPIALPLAISEPDRIRSLVILNSWLFRLDEDPKLLRAARFAGSRFGRFLYRWLNASLRLLMPAAYADRRKLTRAIHAQYLAPFASRDDRERVLWTLARALLQSRDTFARIWAERSRLSRVPTLVVWGLSDGALPPTLLSRLREGLPQARVEALDNVGHWPQEEAPEQVAELLDGFLPRASEARAKLESA